MYVVRAATVLAALVGPTARLPVRRAAMPVCMAGPPVDALSESAAGAAVTKAPASAGKAKHAKGQQRSHGSDPASDWGGLPAAISASRSGAINNQIAAAVDAEGVLKLTVDNAGQLNSVNIATALHRIAAHLKRSRAQRDRVLRDDRFLALLDATEARASECNPRSVSDILWAFATLQHFPATMLKPLLTQVAAHLEAKAFEAQHLALIVWSFAVLELKPVKLLDAIDATALRQIHTLNPQNCANVLWGFAKLNYKPPSLLAPMSAKLLEPAFLERMKPVEVSDCTYALSVIGTPDGQGNVLKALARRAQPENMLSKFTSRQLVLLTWAFARMQMRPDQLEVWIAEIQTAHAIQPLLAHDGRNLEVALERFGEDSTWLHPPKEEEGEEQEEEVA